MEGRDSPAYLGRAIPPHANARRLTGLRAQGPESIILIVEMLPLNVLIVERLLMILIVERLILIREKLLMFIHNYKSLGAFLASNYSWRPLSFIKARTQAKTVPKTRHISLVNYAF